ncbi:MAG: tetratricopeptide repeat protein [Planctomycetota bacterium]
MKMSVIQRAGALVGVLLCAVVAAGQDAHTLQELRKLHAELCAPGQVISTEQGTAAVARLREWNLSGRRLEPEDCGRLLLLEVCANLAVGDVQRAAAKLKELEPYVADTQTVFESRYLVAVVTGDADVVQATLKKLAEVAGKEQSRLLSQRRRWAKSLGQPAPDVEITASAGTRLAVRERFGVVLILDFWNRRDTTTEYAQALTELYATCRTEMRVRFVGINNDGPAKLTEARAAAERLGYVWPQHYEGESGEKYNREVFSAGTPPWTVLVDGRGVIRAVGSVTEPAFQYTLRAALAESGQPAEERVPDRSATEPSGQGQATGPQAGGSERPVSKNDLPSNPEAAGLLRQARAFMKTGMKKKARELLERIIREYPGTREAKDAQERLGLLP